MRISQREARKLKREVVELREQERIRRSSWHMDYPGGTEITRAQFEPLSSVAASIRTARKLEHAVVAITDDGGLVRFIALPLAAKS